MSSFASVKVRTLYELLYHANYKSANAFFPFDSSFQKPVKRAHFRDSTKELVIDVKYVVHSISFQTFFCIGI